ncbi:MAG TPA: hypothetical protein DDW45_04400 [Gammaproteobacteria bacterium]|nr:hypothetical protein [Gammaproteobacteria bacterium]
MSLILDALRKSEHGRHGASDSVLPLIVTPRAGATRKKRVAYLPILIMLLVVIATVVIFIYRETIFPPQTVTQMPATAPAVAKPQSQLVQQSQQQRRTTPPIRKAQQAATHEFGPTDSIPPVGSEKPPVIGTEVPAPLPPVADRPKVVKRSLPQKPESVTPPEPKSKPIPEFTPKPKPESVKRDAIPAALSTFPADFIRKVQPLHLDFHVYSFDISRRMVYINNREYAEGDRLKNSLKVVRIVPQGAVMQWNQQSFLLTAQD